MATDRLIKLESSTREQYWVPDPVIPNPITGGGGGGSTSPVVIPPGGTPSSWGSSPAGFPPPNPSGGGGGSGGDNDNSDYTLLSELLDELEAAGASGSEITEKTIVNDLPPDDPPP